ncbi:MAG: hypothetical protein WCW01_06270 [Gammaproteobacteria bacterium]
MLSTVQPSSSPFYVDKAQKFFFYIDEESGKLRAEVKTGEVTQPGILIKGLPQEWQSHLTDPARQKKLKKLLEKSSFVYRNLDVHVAPGGFGLLGGWNKDVHQHRTLEWAKEVFNGNEKWVHYVAKSCQKVDTGKTDPVLHYKDKDAQSWHFNVNRGHSSSRGGDFYDSRIQHARERFRTALAKKKDGKDKQALQTLGTGLHALQDCIAHLDRLVRKSNLLGTHFYHHIRSPFSSAGTSDTDDPRFIADNFWSPKSNNPEDHRQGFSLRYTYTRDLTKMYLEAYKNNDLAFANKISDEVIKRIDSLKRGLPLEGEILQDVKFDELPDIYRKVLKLIPKELKQLRHEIGKARAMEIPGSPTPIDFVDFPQLALPSPSSQPALPSKPQESQHESANTTVTAIASSIGGYAGLFAVLGKLAADGWHKLNGPKQVVEYVPSQRFVAEVQNVQKQLDILQEKIKAFSLDTLAKYSSKAKNLPQAVTKFIEQELKQLRWSYEDCQSDLVALQRQKHATEKELSNLQSNLEYLSKNACKEVEQRINDFWSQQAPTSHAATRTFLIRHQAAVCLASGYRPLALPSPRPMLAVSGEEVLRNTSSKCFKL